MYKEIDFPESEKLYKVRDFINELIQDYGENAILDTSGVITTFGFGVTYLSRNEAEKKVEEAEATLQAAKENLARISKKNKK